MINYCIRKKLILKKFSLYHCNFLKFNFEILEKNCLWLMIFYIFKSLFEYYYTSKLVLNSQFFDAKTTQCQIRWVINFTSFLQFFGRFSLLFWDLLGILTNLSNNTICARFSTGNWVCACKCMQSSFLLKKSVYRQNYFKINTFFSLFRRCPYFYYLVVIHFSNLTLRFPGIVIKDIIIAFIRICLVFTRHEESNKH